MVDYLRAKGKVLETHHKSNVPKIITRKTHKLLQSPKYEETAINLLKDPWAARDSYIDIVLDRSSDNVQRFLEQHRTHELNGSEMVTVLKILELQRHTMLMYTSCGWFFDELSGIETVQVIQYAGRAVQLAQEHPRG